MKICSRKLTTCKVVGDGGAVELGLLDRSGTPVCVQLPFDQAGSLVMTLPHVLALALKRRTGLKNSRYVFRISMWSIESTEDDKCLIVTLKTADGFEVSLGMPFDTCRPLGVSLHCEAEKARVVNSA